MARTHTPNGDGTTTTVFYCDRCHEQKTYTGSFTTGYGRTDDEQYYCFDCCGELDREAMHATGRATLYLSKRENGAYDVGNWPGTLRFPVRSVSKGYHTIAGTRYDFHFTDDQGRRWWGVQYGDWTQVAHCKRLKA